ncbi:MAG: flagellar biosynthesis protein FlhB [Alphaproteobacteria bacterium]|nr:flagellar biosynthesis protein FlhB [Alphaproteobacteria bacterium]
MADDNDPDSKTEEPSGKKIEDSRERGNVVQSKDIGSFMMLLAATLMLGFGGALMAQWVTLWGRVFVEKSHLIRIDDLSFQSLMVEQTINLALVMAIPLAVFVIIGIASNIATHGLIWTTDPLEPKLDRIDPIAGFKRLFSLRMVFETVKGVIKMAIVGAVVTFLLWPELVGIERYVSSEIGDSLDSLFWLLVKLMAVVTAVVAVISIGDYLYARYEYLKNLRMTKQEVKEEYKQQEGDPHVKARLKQLRQEKSRKRMMAAVPGATVVVTNPTHYAVALKYDQSSMGAPLVVAKGTDMVAKRIRDIAYENFVPVVENAPLARNLYSLVEVDQEIPPDLYKATAEVIGYVMRLKRAAIR